MSLPAAELVGLSDPRARAVVVDDTPDIRQLLGIALARAGIEVVAEAGNGRDGIRVAAQHQPDFVLLDLSMPDMDGMSALPEIRKQCRDAVIVVLSGFAAEAVAAEALERGASAYVPKGTPMAQLVDRLWELRGADEAVDPPAVGPVSQHPPAVDALPAGSAERHPAGSGTPQELALAHAPLGILVLGPAPERRVLFRNARAAVLLGASARGGAEAPELLAQWSPALATMVEMTLASPPAPPPTEGVSGGRLGDGPGALQVTVIATGAAGAPVAVYLQAPDAEVDRLRRAMAASAHELRTPATVLSGAAEVLQLPPSEVDDETRARLLRSVHRQAELLEGITADMLAAAQAERGVIAVHAGPIAAGDVVRGVVEDRYDVDLRVRADPLVRADPVWLEQMVANLLSNAVKYGAQPLVVTVRRGAGAHTGSGEVIVRDHGPGVPSSFRSRLFDEFARAPGTTARGTGLGLYVVRSLAEAMGGSIEYRDAEGGGAQFTLRLPLATAPGEGPSTGQDSLSGT